jgi:cytohesin
VRANFGAEAMATKEQVGALREAITAGDEAVAEGLLAAAPDLAKDWRPILEAALYGRAAMVERLLDLGADPNAQSVSETRHRPLRRAIEPKKSIPRTPGHLETLRVLLGRGADVDGPGCYYDGRPLQCAARADDTAAAEILLAYGAKADIFRAVLMGDEDLFDTVLNADPSLATTEAESRAQPLHLLCSSKFARPVAVRMAERLVAAGASAAHVAPMRHIAAAPIHFVCFQQDIDLALLAFLLDHGSQPQEALYETLWQGEHAAAALLHARGASFEAPWAGSGRPMLCEMIHWGRAATATWMVGAGADVNVAGKDDLTPLHYAASRGSGAPLVRTLIEAGARLDARDSQGETPAALARRLGRKTFEAAVA